jgi:lipoprotein-releasing system permease protein
MRIFSYPVFLIAWRYLRTKRREGFISVIALFSFLGITLGVGTLIVVMAVMNGFRIELTGKILGLGGHISVYGYERGILDFDSLAEKVKKIPGVSAVYPVVTGQALLLNGGATSGVLVRSMRTEELKKRDLIANHIIAGSLDNAEKGIVLGSRLAAQLGVGVGDVVSLLSPQTRTTVMGKIPRSKSFTVIALFEAGMYEFDNSTAYLPLEIGQALFRYPRAVNELELLLDEPEKSDKLRATISELVEPYSVQDWQMKNASFFQALQVERSVMFLILALIVLVAAFNIISGLVMLVKDKTRDIAILRTMGATRGMIIQIFFLCGAAIGVFGTISGVLIGVAFAKNIESIRQFLQQITGTTLFDPLVYFLSELPADIVPSDVIRITIMAIALSFLATIYPAWKAAKTDPAEAVKYG